MSQDIVVSGDLTEDQVLARTRGVRLRIVSKLTETAAFPQDPDEAKLLIKALDGLDKQVLTTKRMKLDADIAAGQAASGKEVVAALLSKLSHAPGMSASITIIEAPVLGAEIPVPEILPGEMDIGTKQLNFESFMDENRPVVPEDQKAA